MARRRRSKRKRGRALRWVIIAAIAVLIAGFAIRRALPPALLREFGRRPPAPPLAASAGVPAGGAGLARAPRATGQPLSSPAPREHLDSSDRRSLDDVIRRHAY